MVDCSAKVLITLTTTYGIASNAVQILKEKTSISIPVPIITIKHEVLLFLIEL